MHEQIYKTTWKNNVPLPVLLLKCAMLQRTDHKKKDKGGQQKQNMLSLDPLVHLHLCVPHVARASAPMDTVFHTGIDIPALGFHHISQHHWPHKPRCMTRYLKPSSPQSIRWDFTVASTAGPCWPAVESLSEIDPTARQKCRTMTNLSCSFHKPAWSSPISCYIAAPRDQGTEAIHLRFVKMN